MIGHCSVLVLEVFTRCLACVVQLQTMENGFSECLLHHAVWVYCVWGCSEPKSHLCQLYHHSLRVSLWSVSPLLLALPALTLESIMQLPFYPVVTILRLSHSWCSSTQKLGLMCSHSLLCLHCPFPESLKLLETTGYHLLVGKMAHWWV